MSRPKNFEAQEIATRSLNKYERETVVTAADSENTETTIVSNDGDKFINIWSAQRKYINRLRKAVAPGRVEELRTGFHGDTEWAEFRIPAALWNPVTGLKRVVNMSDERKEELRERLKGMREKKASSN
jgi:hypothetical protein